MWTLDEAFLVELEILYSILVFDDYVLVTYCKQLVDSLITLISYTRAKGMIHNRYTYSTTTW